MSMNLRPESERNKIMKRTPRFRKPVLRAGLAVVVGGVVTVAVTGASGASGFATAAPDGVSPAMPASIALATTVQPEQRSGFAVLARPRTTRDTMPADARAQVGNGPQTGRNVDLSRVVTTLTGTGWVIPGNGTVCLAVPDPVDGYGLACDKTEDALSRGVVSMMISSKTPDVARVTLLAPANSSVSVTTADGQQKPLGVDASGVISATLTGAKQISVSTAAGTKNIVMPVPPPTVP